MRETFPEPMAAATCLDLEVSILSEVSQTDKDECQRYPYLQNLKMTQTYFKKQKQTHRHRSKLKVTWQEEGWKG